MNTPYVKEYDKFGKVLFPAEGVVNHFPSNRGNRYNPRPINNRKRTEGRMKTLQVIKMQIGESTMTIFHNHQGRPSRRKPKTWVKPHYMYKAIVHHTL